MEHFSEKFLIIKKQIALKQHMVKNMTEDLMGVWSWALVIRSWVSHPQIPKRNLRLSPKICTVFMYLVWMANEWPAHRVSALPARDQMHSIRQWMKFHFPAVQGPWEEHMEWEPYCRFPVPAHPFMWPWTNPPRPSLGLSEPISFLICDMWVVSHWVTVRIHCTNYNKAAVY